MVRLGFLWVLLVLGLQLAQAQFVSVGPPASALSPTPDGRLHGVPASALSLKPVPAGVQTQRHFFSSAPQRPFRPFEPRHHHHVFVPVPLFYPYYGSDYPYQSTADPNVAQATEPPQADEDAASASNEDALRQAYLQGARDAMRNELDSAQRKPDTERKPEAKPSPKKSSEEEPAAAQPDDSPATVFIFKDGHQVETKNFAIMGQTLYDLSGSTVKKVQLNDLDSAATLRANDDRGIQVKLP